MNSSNSNPSRSWTMAEVEQSLLSNNPRETAKQINRTKDAVYNIRSLFSKWKRGKKVSIILEDAFKILESNIEPHYFSNAPKEILDKRFMSANEEKPFSRGIAGIWKLEELMGVLKKLKEGQTPKQISATTPGRTSQSVSFVCGYYNKWHETGKIYAGHEKQVELFKQIDALRTTPMTEKDEPRRFPNLEKAREVLRLRKAAQKPVTGVTIGEVAVIAGGESLHKPMISAKRDPLTELDILMDSFKENLAVLIPLIADDMIKGQFEAGYTKGKEEGEKEGFNLGKEATELNNKNKSFSELLKSKFGMKGSE